uniref:START domain-containing protein n=1 Tax=Panagrolaimus sp. JU765 TaxID=591449 RepID=A0AC34QKJ2_9BILA
MYRRIFLNLQRWVNFSKIRRSFNYWSGYSQWTKRIQSKYYVSPLLALSGISIKDYGLANEDIKEESEKTQENFVSEDEISGWEVLVEERDLRVYRRRLPGKRELYEYKCAGTYYDISPRNFVDAQCDVAYRREWDTNVVTLDILDSDEDTDTQVVRWVAKFPYPMYPRVYIYVRRKIVDENNGRIVVCSRALDENAYPDDGKYVRVTWYRSSMSIQAHSTFDEDGLDYVLTYYDDPQSNIPSVAYNWIVNRGGPYFLKQVHEAAKKLEQSPRSKKPDLVEVIRINMENNNATETVDNYQPA